MDKHILVATDGSDTAARAVTWAAEIAAKFDLPLTVAHVLQHGRPIEELSRMAEVEHLVRAVREQSAVRWENLPGSMGALFAGKQTTEDAVRLVTLIGDEIVKRAVDSARHIGAMKVDSRVSDGDYADEILDMAEKVGADMIVVGHRGLGRLREMLLGSVAHKVNQAADVTVVTVR